MPDDFETIEPESVKELSGTEVEEQDDVPEEPMVVCIVKEPHSTRQEYYKIEKPNEFFGDAYYDTDKMKQKIRSSGIEPFTVLEVPPVKWMLPD